MTSQQILHADVLDILFEHRNKMYGAYQLRRTYSLRLLSALLFTFLAIAFLLWLLSLKGKENILPVAANGGEIEVRLIEMPPNVIHTPPPVQSISRPAAARTQFNQIVIKADVDVAETVPTQDVIEGAVISNITSAGTPYDGTTPPVENGHGQGIAATAPEPEKAFVPSYSAPQFPGGAEAWMRFLSRHLRAPEGLAAGEKKSVLIRFLVSADGSITQYEVLQSGGTPFDSEVIRVLKKMPKWKPALQNGAPVTVTFHQPVTFVAPEE